MKSHLKFALTSLAMATLVAAGSLNAEEAGPEFRHHPFFQFDIESSRTADVTLADVDGDGDLDAVIANGRHWAQQDFVFLNIGDGRLLEALPLGARKSASYTVQSGDLDGDGDPDAVLVRDMLPTLIFTNDGTGNFTLAGIVEGSVGPARSGVLADIDGDGALDLVIATRRGPDRMFKGDGKAGFSAGMDLPDKGHGSTGIAHGDFDRDGDIDLVFARRDGAASVVMLNNGQGRFRPVPLPQSEGDHRKVGLGDMNGDGTLDIVLVSTGGPHLLYAQDSKGTIGKPARFGKDNDAAKALAIGDLDRDGDLDLVLGANGPNVIYLNNGEGQFARNTLARAANTYGAALGDMNGDGALDIVFANSGSANEVVISRVPKP